MRRLLSIAIGLFLIVCNVGRGEDWPQFRGLNGSATSADSKLPVEWSSDKNVAWKVSLPGSGWSQPVIWKDKVFVTTAVGDKASRPGRGGGMMFGRKPDTVYKWELHCLSAADGETLWKQTAAEKKPLVGSNPSNGYATETPATDGERVYAYFGGIGMVYCYDLDGKPLWNADVGAYATQMNNGTASSPVVADGRVFIQCDNEEKSFLVALDAKTGKEVWRDPRDERTGWSTPLVWKNSVRTEIVCIGSPQVRSYDPATGKQLWVLGGLSGQIKASAVADSDLLYVGSGGGFGGFGGFGGPGPGGRGGFPRRPGGDGNGRGGPPPADGDRGARPPDDGGPPESRERQRPEEGDDRGGPPPRDENRRGPGGFQRGPGGRGGAPSGPGGGPGGMGFGGGSRPLFAVKAGASGDITLKSGESSSAGVAWKVATGGASTPSPLVYDGYLYVLEDRGGVVTCYDAKTGDKKYKERISGARGFTSSPVGYGGKVFCLDEDGTTWVLKAGPKFEVVGENKLGEMAWSSPAASNGALYVRTADHLYCIRE
jgi:outer membrane protein assembly factor BamB